ncbi:hypothetical protein BCR35DRAFT_319588 [Leucosporidium creatinivorum]|uniref:Sterol 3-beta-glucosyltransferase n=1 Tax=Leucosporidium creatinivorum TaxID=106004 RepID=A0A1Y2D6U0_9BASI|nr:hypothetical protein BCR35DRAFT_319588 [Leucosporidium creatinivorum]
MSSSLPPPIPPPLTTALTTPLPPSTNPSRAPSPSPSPALPKVEIPASKSEELNRSLSSSTTVERRKRLASKLEEVFGFQEGAEEVVAEFPCWLFRSILLQGFLFLTTDHLAFYAYLHPREGKTLRSGALSARGPKTRHYFRHWFVLKADSLSWYPSSTDPYFPLAVLDLHYITAIEPSKTHARHWKILKAEGRWEHFSADSEASRDEWVKAVRKAVFRCRNEGESVKISIPLSTILSIERSTSLEFAEMIRIKVYDAEEGEGGFEEDEYWLSYFEDLEVALGVLRGGWERWKREHPEEQEGEGRVEQRVESSLRREREREKEGRKEEQGQGHGKSTSWSESLSSRLRLFPSSSSSSASAPLTSSKGLPPPSSAPSPLPSHSQSSTASPPPPQHSRTSRHHLIPLLPPLRPPPTPNPNPTTATPNHHLPLRPAPFFLTLEPPPHPRQQFPAYLFRGLPIYGKIIISTTFLCFKSTGVLAKTRMILPFSDIIGLSKHRSYRIGYSGLIVVIKGHEEIFFELSTSERRDECMAQLEHRVELVQQQLAEGETPGDTKEHREHLDLLNLAASRMSLGSTEGGEEQERLIEQALFRTSTGSSIPHPPSESIANQPPIMFCSTSSDFVTFRPEKSLKFTCLTIGSRGDVQPYIALCKGLMAEGHRCRIASHGEYRKWVEGHGIEFEEVGGDPAELMQLMIAHDFFTISFMKEAVGRFRGWLDDLLETTWKACQDTDVLIESPSAIAGYHIAEALRIPYYRAFTMPWSRTRAYPHAFAVPDHKMGGGYNYMTYTMFEQIFWRATSGQVNRWRRKTLGIRSTNLEVMQQHKIPFLYNFSPVVVPPPLDWRENIHPPADLLAFLDKAKAASQKVVFVGFGSIIIPDPLEMTRVVSEAVQQSDVYAIVAKGCIPHDWLFPRIDAAVHHGGAGTTGASLRAGLPTIIKPFFGDQHFYADRVATLGIGSAVRDMTVANLAEAIIKAVTDEKQISRAKLAGEAIRKEDGVGNAIECIYRDLEYAKSLIPPPSNCEWEEHDCPRGGRDCARPSSTGWETTSSA